MARLTGGNYFVAVKNHIDFIYGLTFKEEYIGTWKRYNNRLLEECVTELIKRGILQKHLYTVPGSIGRRYSFLWVASMAPTNHLAKSVGEKLREIQTERRRRYVRRKASELQSDIHKSEEEKEQEKKENPSIETTHQTIIPNREVASNQAKISISSLSDAELWNELKRRGYEIENGKVVLITRKYLD